MSRAGYALTIIVILGLLLVGFVKYARADSTSRYPIYAPSECTGLAQREDVPLIIENAIQEAKARAKMAIQNRRDPLVKECRSAIKRLKAEMKK